MELYELNNVSIFLYPLLEIPKEVFKQNYINSYLSDSDVDLYKENHLFLMYREDDEELIKELKEHKLFKNTYKISNNRVVVFDFELSEYWRDYLIFKKGKYSLMSRDAKNQVTKDSYNHYKHLGLIEDVFNKSESLRQFKMNKLEVHIPKTSELWSIYDDSKDIITKDIRQCYNNSVKL